MKFASVYYSHSIDELKINPLLKKLPQKILDFYLKRTNPCVLEETMVLDTPGMIAILPLLKEEAQENNGKWESIVKKTLEKLKEEEVEIIIPPKQGPFLNNIIPVADGKTVLALFINQAVEKALKYSQKEKKSASFVLIDGANPLSRLTLDSIYPYINYLSIYTDRAESFTDKIQEIYEDTGLIVNLFHNYKNAFLKEADVVINCGSDMENYDYFFKKNAIYFDVNKNRLKSRRIRAKRKDMIFVDGLELKIDNEYYTGEIFEAVQFIKNNAYHSLLTRQYHKNSMEEVKKSIEKYHIAISSLRLESERVKRF